MVRLRDQLDALNDLVAHAHLANGAVLLDDALFVSLNPRILERFSGTVSTVKVLDETSLDEGLAVLGYKLESLMIKVVLALDDIVNDFRL